jgi:hypothetical protein
VGERHGEISEEDSNVNVVIKHSNTYQLGNRAVWGGGGGRGGDFPLSLLQLTYVQIFKDSPPRCYLLYEER